MFPSQLVEITRTKQPYKDRLISLSLFKPLQFVLFITLLACFQQPPSLRKKITSVFFFPTFFPGSFFLSCNARWLLKKMGSSYESEGTYFEEKEVSLMEIGSGNYGYVSFSLWKV